MRRGEGKEKKGDDPVKEDKGMRGKSRRKRKDKLRNAEIEINGGREKTEGIKKTY